MYLTWSRIVWVRAKWVQAGSQNRGNLMVPGPVIVHLGDEAGKRWAPVAAG